MKKSLNLVFILWCLTSAILTIAAPADWYKWRSKIDATEVCAQTSPGDGWEKFAGPFANSRCEKLKR